MEWNGPISVLLAYLLGAIPFGFLLVKLTAGSDVRATGSGSTGATNVTRAAGPAVGLMVLVLDLLKGYSAVWLADALTRSDEAWVGGACVAAIIGHSYPVFLKFLGGKSVAVGLGVFLYLFPPLNMPLALPLGFAVWAATMLAWRYVSLASVLASAAFPVITYAFYQPPVALLAATVAGCCVIILRHRANIERLAAGTEPKFKLRY